MATIDEVITRSSEASKGGFQAIEKIRGILAPIDIVDGLYGKQAKVTLIEAVVLRMEEGEEEPELRDEMWITYYPYGTAKSRKPTQRQFFVAGFVKSAEAEDARRRGIKDDEIQGLPEEDKPDLKNLYGTVVTIEKQDIYLFKRPVSQGSEEMEEVWKTGYVVAVDENGDDPAEMDEIVRGLVVGKNKDAATRAILLNARAKQDPKYKDALATDVGDFAVMLGLTVVDGIFTGE